MSIRISFLVQTGRMGSMERMRERERTWCKSSRLPTHHIAQDNFELLSLLPLPPSCTQALLCLVYLLIEVEPVAKLQPLLHWSISSFILCI